MKKAILTDRIQSSPEFTFKNECHICAVGTGTFTIERDVGMGFYPLTTEDGVQMSFTPDEDGLMFNSVIKYAGASPKYRVTAVTTGEIEYVVDGGKV